MIVEQLPSNTVPELTAEQLNNFLQHASLYQIYRLSKAVLQAREEPARIDAVRHMLRAGDMVEYFSDRKHALIKATVLKKNPKYVVVRNACDNKCWNIRYCVIKMDDRACDFHQKPAGLTPQTVKVGDLVGFVHRDERIIGQVERVNQKTVSLVTQGGEQWRVGYGGLYPVIDGEVGAADAAQCSLLD